MKLTEDCYHCGYCKVDLDLDKETVTRECLLGSDINPVPDKCPFGSRIDKKVNTSAVINPWCLK